MYKAIQSSAYSSPVLVVTAPARANLIGNPSDQYGGSTLSCSVPLRARVEVSAAPKGLLETAGQSFRIAGAEDLAPRGDRFDIARCVLAHLGIDRPEVCVRYGSEIPLQSGMAGSTALVVALLRALLEWLGEPPGAYALAERARRVEREQLGVQCGYVDQYLAVFGGLRHVDLRGKAREDAGPTPYASVEDLAPHVSKLPFVLAFTGVRHSSDSVHRPLRERWEAGETEVVTAYERIGELGRLGKRALLDAAWDELGALMDENHAIQQRLGGSGPSNDRLIEAARAAGAPGAKLAGAGRGGTIVALWPEKDPAPLEAALRRAGATALYRPHPVPGTRLE